MLNILFTFISIFCDTYAWVISKSHKREVAIKANKEHKYLRDWELFSMIDTLESIIDSFVWGHPSSYNELSQFVHNKALNVKRYLPCDYRCFDFMDLRDWMHTIYSLHLSDTFGYWDRQNERYIYTRKEFMQIYACMYLCKELLHNKVFIDTIEENQSYWMLIRAFKRTMKFHAKHLHMEHVDFSVIPDEE